MDLETTLKKWHDAKSKLELLEEKIKKYKAIVCKEMSKQNVEKLSSGEFTVTRRRNTRTYLSKENVPTDIWKEYSTKCSYDAYFLVKKY